MKNSLNCWVFAAMLMLKCHTVHAYDFEANGIYYNIESSSDLTVSVTYYDFNYNKYYIGNISIPSTVTYLGETYSVTSIGRNAFFNSNELTGINIPNSVINIENAFAYCPYLTNISVDEGNEKYDSRNNCNAVIETATNKLVVGCQNTIIPESVTSIGDVAYFGCYNLTSLNIPNNITHIGKQAFQNNRDLTSINIPKSIISIGEKAFHRCFHLTSIIVDPNNSVYDSRNGCNAIMETTTNELIVGCAKTIIPNSTKSIKDFAFYQCSQLTSIDIPSSVTNIGEYAFCGCAGLTNIDIPSSVTDIGEYAFYECTGLTRLDIPNGVSSIEPYAFSNCIGLTVLNISNSVKSIKYSAFSMCKGLTKLYIPKSVMNIESGAFSGSTNITCIEVDSHNTTYDSRKNCNAIIETATNSLFLGCNNTKIPNDVSLIKNSAFSGRLDLVHIVIPKSVIEIEKSAFQYCKNLSVVTNFATVPQSIVGSTFNKCKCDTLYVPAGCKAVYEAAPYWNQFKYIIEIETDITLNDGESYNSTETNDYNQLIYSRTFSNSHWQALYVPFSIPVDSLSKYGLQVAELNDTHQWDFNGDGVADSTRVEFFTLTSGSTEANYPYLIRATEPTTLSLTLKDIEVKAAEENSIECSSTKQKFTFVGTYTGVSGADMYDNNYYGMSGGGLKRVSNNTVSLKPQRWYMKIENKNGSPVTYYAPSIRFIVDGIEDEAETSDLDLPTVDSDLSAPMYSIEGIRQTSTQLQPGLYVRQGKKIVIR